MRGIGDAKGVSRRVALRGVRGGGGDVCGIVKIGSVLKRLAERIKQRGCAGIEGRKGGVVTCRSSTFIGRRDGRRFVCVWDVTGG